MQNQGAVISSYIEKSQQINWLPAKIISYDTEKSTASVKPLIKVNDVELPIIPSVKVMRLGCADFTIKIPHKAGDIVRLMFTRVGIDNFEERQSLSSENLFSKGSLANCYAIPTEYGNAQDYIEVKEGKLTIKMQSNITLDAGGVKILSNISDQLEKVTEALDELGTVLQSLGGAVVPPMSGSPQPLTVSGSLISAGGKVASASSAIASLKSQLDDVI